MRLKTKSILNKTIMIIMTLLMIFTSFSNLQVIHAASENVFFEVDKSNEVINEAKKHIGKSYVWGAAGPNEFDCSGYMSYIFKQVGLKFNSDRFTTNTLEAYFDNMKVTNYQYSTNEGNPKNAKKGDIIFYYDNTGDPMHMGLYIGDGNIIHCAASMPSGPQNQVMISKVDALGEKHGTSIVSYKVYRVFPDIGGVRIRKTDENGNALAGVTFKLINPYGEELLVKTNSNGIWDSDIEKIRLENGNYTYQEVSTVEGFVLDTTVRTFTITNGVKAEANIHTVTNKRAVGHIIFTKYNDDKTAKVPNTKYHVTSTDGYNAYHTTDTEGKLELTSIPLSTYTFREVEAGNGYLLNTNPIVVEVKYKDMYTEVVVANGEQTNKEPTAKINLKKVDNETGNTPQGDAVLSGAVYELRAGEDIYNKGRTHKFYSKGDVVTTRTTKNDGSMDSVESLPLGHYVLNESLPSNGYLIDKNSYDIYCTYEGQDVEVVVRSQTSKEQVKKQAFQIIKVSTVESGEADKLAGAEFTVKLTSEIEKVGWDNAKTYDILTTDKKGYSKSIELPYGVFTVRETKPLEDVFIVPDFTVTVDEDNREPQVWRVMNDAPFKALIKAIKVDEETNKTILLPDTEFKIKNLSTGEYVKQWVWFPIPHLVETFVTDKSGTVMTPNTLECAEYQLEEIKSPYGFVLNTTPIRFKVTNQTAYEIAEDGKTPVITVTKENLSVKGKISVLKVGEQLSETQKDKNGNIQFIYKEGPVDGAKFIVKAAEDIFTADNQGVKIYSKGEVVSELTTKEGKATTALLPLGKYTVEESLAGDSFILNKEIKEVELTYKDQETEVVFKNVDYKNERQKAKVTIVKKDADTNQPLSAATFGLFAKEDILINGKVVVAKGELIEKAITNENGEAVFKADMPLKLFEVKELVAPLGYASSDIILDINATYQGQEVDTIDIVKEFKNKIIQVEVSKQDITTSKEISGAHLTVKEKDGSTFDTWISGDTPHIIKGLEVGKTYELIETSSPYGFSIATTIEFTIRDTGEIQKVEMKDNLVVGRLQWTKTGSVFTHTVSGLTEVGKVEEPVFEKKNIVNAEISIYAAEDITLGNGVTYFEKDELIQTLTSGSKMVESQDLLVGKYYYLEIQTPPPFVEDKEKHYFEIEDNQKQEMQIIKSELFNKRASIDINLKKVMEEHPYYASDHKKDYQDVVFGIFTREDISNYEGVVAIDKDTLVFTSGINEDGQLDKMVDLPEGKYFIKELSTNDNYLLDESEYDFEISYQGKEISELIIDINDKKDIVNQLKRTDVIINKIDKITKEPLADVEFALYDKDMKEIQKAISNKDGIAIFSSLPNGVYFCKEVKAQKAYALSNEVVRIEIDGNSKDGKYQVTMTNVLLPAASDSVQTGDSSNIQFYLCIATLAVVVIASTIRLYRKKNDKK